MGSALVGCATAIPGTPGSEPPPPAVTTKPVQPLVAALRSLGYDCGQAAQAPVPVWQCFATGDGGVQFSVAVQARADATTGGLLVSGSPPEGGGGATGGPVPKPATDALISRLLPQVLAEPQLAGATEWVRISSDRSVPVPGLHMSYGQTYGNGAKFELLTADSATLQVQDPAQASARTMAGVAVPALQGFGQGNGMACDTSSRGSLSCADKATYLRSMSVTPGRSGGVDLATFTLRTGDRAQAVALFTAFATVVSADGAADTAEWLRRRVGADGEFSTAAPGGVRFTVRVARSAGLDPEYRILAAPVLF
ncbi:hypothetical protein [Pseudonocardia sp. GCM10023141]|uniref:hypothetical protein n=1 Tax=Pseudonocardia sp. GCM10023141 TaxID=3252653 RepID=UPI00361233A0